ncbi:hypothetical protein C0J52_24321 [Blattella germanica]|nr:hypothetical protein C0J52_24321 [Blattella germanica]
MMSVFFLLSVSVRHAQVCYGIGEVRVSEHQSPRCSDREECTCLKSKRKQRNKAIPAYETKWIERVVSLRSDYNTAPIFQLDPVLKGRTIGSLEADQSRFSLNSDSRRTIIWRGPGSRFHPTKIVENAHLVVEYSYGQAQLRRRYCKCSEAQRRDTGTKRSKLKIGHFEGDTLYFSTVCYLKTQRDVIEHKEWMLMEQVEEGYPHHQRRRLVGWDTLARSARSLEKLINKPATQQVS